MSAQFNTTVLMSGADYFNDGQAINALMDSSISVDIQKATTEHNLIAASLDEIGVKITKIPPPPKCQDGVYTANWALVRQGKALMARLPNARKGEEDYAKATLEKLGIQIFVLPAEVDRFSGQGDALPCGSTVFTQSPYRTTTTAHPYLKSILGFEEVIVLQTKPARRFKFGPPKINKITGWPDSPTYDIDLAIAILRWPSEGKKGLIAWCPDVFTSASRKILKNYNKVDKIEVSHKEAMEAFALNLVSTGDAVVMNSGAPNFQTRLEREGFKVKALALPELKKGGGSIRCTTLTLHNS
jgi:N-dimethylarginine dimethylaminohydrolase